MVQRGVDVLFVADRLEDVMAWGAADPENLEGAAAFRVPVIPEGSEGWTTWSSAP